MSSSHSDEDRNVSQYDIEDDLYVYGSPVYSTQVASDTQPSLPAASHVTHARTQKFIGGLTVEQKDKVLLEVLSNGKGSLDYANNLVEFGGHPSDPPQTKPPWCTSGVCQPMPTEEENRSCKKIR
ncbi:Hypothetical predicted protein, partial [Paramuricea clavata]